MDILRKVIIILKTLIIFFDDCESPLSETEESLARQQRISLPESRDQACQRSASSRVM